MHPSQPHKSGQTHVISTPHCNREKQLNLQRAKLRGHACAYQKIGVKTRSKIWIDMAQLNTSVANHNGHTNPKSTKHMETYRDILCKKEKNCREKNRLAARAT